MSYRYLEINLLPPELRPGPAVRLRLILIWLLLLATVSFVMLDSFLGLTRIAQQREQRAVLQGQIDKQQYIVEEHASLKAVDNYVMKTGKLVSMASTEYLDLPVVASRVASLLPDGVFLERITNNRPGKGTTVSDVGVTLVASREDPSLVLAALNAFKADPILSNCYMRVAEREERSLGLLLSGSDVNWIVSGPEYGSEIIVNHYVFEIHSLVQSPIDGKDFRVVYDDSRYLAGFEKRMEDEQAAEVEGDPASGVTVLNAPAGVTVEGTN